MPHRTCLDASPNPRETAISKSLSDQTTQDDAVRAPVNMGRNDASRVYPLYHSTYSLYRISPLYHGKSPLLSNLKVHARRLRDEITGDSMRGIQIANELAGVPTSFAAGSVQSCTWEVLGNEETWDRQHNTQDDTEDEISGLLDISSQDAVGVHVQVKYEKATYTAILFGEADRKAIVSGFTNLPLLCLKMPAALRELFLNYLKTAFDTRITPMKLQAKFLLSTLEHILEPTVTQDDSGAKVNTDQFPKGLQLQLGFPSTNPQLKNLDISLTQNDLAVFIHQGLALWQQRQLGLNRVSDRVRETKANVVGPFTAALSAYLTSHLALDFEHPAVVLDKIAIGPYALANEGRIKILETTSETKEIWSMLLELAQGQKLRDKEEILREVEKKVGQNQLGLNMAPSRGGSRIPTEPPPPYELHDPALRDELG